MKKHRKRIGQVAVHTMSNVVRAPVHGYWTMKNF